MNQDSWSVYDLIACAGCGSEFKRYRRPGRPRMYCSPQCRTDNRAARKAATADECQWCGADVFQALPPVFCSDACRAQLARTKDLQRKLQGIPQSVQAAPIVAARDELDALRAERTRLKTAARRRRDKLRMEREVRNGNRQLRAKERRLAREMAHLRVENEQLRKADRVARRQAKKGN